jgi:bifunctional UDP-N-acetylglucosamine pyrophosphorylase/glucosamine-1-phosphate N-acetyltransferase
MIPAKEWQLFGFYPNSDYTERMKRAAVILAAGQGKRMNSALPKPLHQVGGRAMLAWAIDAATASGVERIITVLGKDSEPTQQWLGDNEFVIQNPPLGTGHAVQAAGEALAGFNGAVLVMFADTPLITAYTLAALSDRIIAGDDIAVLAFNTNHPKGYGRIVRADDGSVQKIVEDKDTDAIEAKITLVNGGIMAVRAPILFDLLKQVTPANAQGEIYLTDIVAIGREQELTVGCEITDEAEVMGVNDRADLARAEALLQTQLRHAAMQGGVTMQAPETVFLSADSVIERDVIIEPHVIIGNNCHIGEGSIIKSFSHLEGAHLGPCCVIGPYARLRPGTKAGDGVKIGNFVETKNVQMDAGAKANHLTYLGDAEIGAGANIGAGTITCNYDGFNKFKTIIGDGAFIGSNTALVAPVTIGDRAIIGAGSTIAADVAADDISVTRAPSRVTAGAAPAFRRRKKAIKDAAKKFDGK